MMKSILVTILSLVGILTISGQAHSQEFSFQTQITTDNLTTQTCTFGLREEALPGLDQFDIPSPPPSPNDQLNMHLSMMAPPASLPTRWLADFRPIENQNLTLTEFWILHLNNELPGGTATIHTDQLATLPTTFELWLHPPDSSSSLVTVPGTIEISLDASTLIYFWELRFEASVSTNSTTWGGIKSLYR